jgi:hypothetical protein
VKFSFLPGDLHLTQAEDGSYIVTIAGEVVLRNRSQRAATEKYKELRAEMESRFPARELTAEEKAELLQREIADSLVGHNSLGGRKKKSTAGGTRTFGG